MRRLHLASRSPARLKMLRDAGLDVEPCETRADEADLKRALLGRSAAPIEIAQQLAAAKALGVETQGWLVLGADQTLEFDGESFDKPGDLSILRSQLERLSGHTHRLHAAAALAADGRVVWQGVESVELQMRTLSVAELDRYVTEEGRNVLDCVGGYRLGAAGVRLFEAVQGDYFSVLGLPLLRLLAALREIEAQA